MSVPRGPATGAGVDEFLGRLRELSPGLAPEWTPGEHGADAALLRVAAHLLHTVAQRLAQAPDKDRAALHALLGPHRTAPRPARVPVVFRLAEGASEVRLPAGSRVAAPPPREGGTQLVFETAQFTTLCAAGLREVVSLWPGRDQYTDHSADLENGLPLRPFDRQALRPVPHELYLGHDVLLALAGRSSTTVSFDLTTPGSEPLDIRWEYWDGTGWRAFLATDEGRDGTGGLRHSGTYRLETDCAEAARTTVDGVETHWVRGRLAASEPLPPDPGRVLPEIDAIRLSTVAGHGYTKVWRVATGDGTPPAGEVAVLVRDATGVPLENVEVRIEGGERKRTGRKGLAQLTAAPGDTLVVALGAFEQEQRIAVGAGHLVFTLDLLGPDRAVAADGAEVDLSGSFQPFGAQPQPGSVFHFSCEEALSRPGARLRVYVRPAPLQPADGRAARHVVSWEYYNGRAWTSLRTDDTRSPGDLTRHGFVDLPPVPADMTAVEVAGTTAHWLRVRLAGGGYGATRTIAVGDRPTELTLYENRPPVLADLRLGYTWQQGPVAPQHVRTHNDFGFQDRTAQAAWPGGSFQPYTPVAEALPALYLGFDGPLPEGRFGLYLDAAEQSASVLPPTSGVGVLRRLGVDPPDGRRREPGPADARGPRGDRDGRRGAARAVRDGPTLAAGPPGAGRAAAGRRPRRGAAERRVGRTVADRPGAAARHQHGYPVPGPRLSTGAPAPRPTRRGAGALRAAGGRRVARRGSPTPRRGSPFAVRAGTRPGSRRNG
ncbi:hypothetical protein [Streptomyces sp. WG-D5]